MSNSTTNLDLVSTSQSNKEVTVNAALDAASPAMLYGRRASTTIGLAWGYYGGMVLIAGVPTAVANGIITLAASATNYVEANPATGAVSVNSTAFTDGRTQLYQIVAGASTVTSYTDKRTLASVAGVAGDPAGTAAGLMDAHEAAANPHPGYLTQAEADALYAAVAGAVSDGDKGDIVVSGSGTNWAIDSSVISTFGRTLTDDTSASAARTTLGLGTVATLVSDTDTALAADSDTKVATQKAVKAYVDAAVTGGASDVMIFKGVIDCSANPNYPAADAGNLYKISVAGKIGGASGSNVEVGDTIYCITDSTLAGTQGGVGSNWVIAQVNVDGAVVGPASATDSHLAQFDGTTGKLIKGGISLDTDVTMAANSDTRLATQKAVKAYVAAAGTGAAAGSDTQIQFNDGGVYGADADFTWNKTTNILTIGSTSTAGTLTAPATGATSTGVAVTLLAGAGGATSGNGGALNLSGGGSTSGIGGAINLSAGASAAGNKGGAVNITSGTGPAGQNGGDINITAAVGGGGVGLGGAVTIGGTAGGASPINITAGSASGTPGAVAITGGASTSSGTGGAVTVAGGTCGLGTAGAATVRGGDAGGTTAAGGNVTLRGGDSVRTGTSSSLAPGTATIRGGNATGAANAAAGGAVAVNGGQGGASGGAGGAVTITGGAPQAGNGGAVNLTGAAGVGTNKDGGNVNLTPGAATGSGTPGNVVLNNSGAALATTAIGGFTCLPTCAGTPTGTPANIPTGTVPMVFDTTAKKIWIYTGGAWVATAALT